MVVRGLGVGLGIGYMFINLSRCSSFHAKNNKINVGRSRILAEKYLTAQALKL